MAEVSRAHLFGSALNQFFLLFLCSCLLAASSQAGTTTYTYDVHGRLKTQSMPNGTDAVTITNTYDNADNRSSVVTVSVDSAPPNVPTNLSATAVSSQRVNLSWNSVTDNGSAGVAGYRIKREGSTLTSTSGTSYADTTVAGGATYHYTVSAYDNASPPNYSGESAQASATTLPGADTIPPTQPTGLSAAAVSSNWVNLTWTGSTDTGGSGLNHYDVFRNGAKIGNSPVASYADQSTLGTTTYGYYVIAVDGNSNPSTPSNTASVTTPDTLNPTAPSLNAASASGTQVNLSWSASTDTGGSGVARYDVIRTPGGVIGSTTGTSYTDLSVTAVASYSYVVRAYDGAGNPSSNSNPASITTPDWLLPGAPGTPTFSAINGGGATAAWAAASDNVGVTGYRYSLNGGASWTNVGNVLSANLTGLSLGMQYTLYVQASDAAGNWGSSSSNSFVTSSYYTDTMMLVSGTTGDGINSAQWDGYAQGAIGSLTPNTTVNGKTVTSFYTYKQYGFDGVNWYVIQLGTTLTVTGFSGNPGSDWLQSTGSSFSVSPTINCSSSTCTWNWSDYLPSMPSSLTLVHK